VLALRRKQTARLRTQERVQSLWGLHEPGYVYGIIGGAGPVEFYRDAVRAIVIPETEPGIYVDLLK